MVSQQIQILDLIEKDVLEEIIADFTAATQVASVLVDLNGLPITQEHNFSRLCKDFCRSTPEGRASCYASDRFGGSESKKVSEPFIYKCLNAGLMDSATPIIVEGYHVATLVMGQVLTRPLSIDEAVAAAKRIGVDDIAGYLKALEDVLSYQRLQAVVKLMHTIAKTISSLALQKYLSQKTYQKNLHTIINSVSEAIIATDTNGLVTRVNKATVKMIGRDKVSIVGQPIFELFVQPDHFREFLIATVNQETFETPSEFEVCDATGKTIYVQASLQEIFLTKQQIAGHVTVLRDVTREKEIKKMKEDLIGMLTHDMGNPILSIQRVLELILDGHLGTLNSKGNDLIPLALNSTHKLSDMVSNFLDIILSECASLSLRETVGDMNSILSESIQQVGFSADDKKMKIHFQPDDIVQPMVADWGRLQRTCVNLLENAIRFSPVNGEITVTAEQCYSLEQGKILKVCIADQGQGVAAEKQSLIFEKFYTTSAQSGQERRGVGLGLTFSKLVVEAHDGTIGVESPYLDASGNTVSGGRFCFQIPLPSGPQKFDTGENDA